MKRQGFGRIVNTASLAGLGPGLGTTAPYNTTTRNRPIIVVPRRARISWLLLRLSPTLADRLALMATRTARTHSARAGAALL